jgi:hypothetical protein
MFGSLIYGFDKALDKLSIGRGSVKWYQGGCDTNKRSIHDKSRNAWKPICLEMSRK